MFRTLIRVGASALLWSLWLCRNDFIFNNKNPTPCRLFSAVHTCFIRGLYYIMEYQPLFKAVSMRLERMAREVFTK